MNTIGKEALDLLFREVRSYNAYLDTPFAGGVIRQIHEGSKLGPPSLHTDVAPLDQKSQHPWADVELRHTKRVWRYRT